MFDICEYDEDKDKRSFGLELFIVVEHVQLLLLLLFNV
jgi:hypothetical protein